jgi:hypothetical protein
MKHTPELLLVLAFAAFAGTRSYSQEIAKAQFSNRVGNFAPALSSAASPFEAPALGLRPKITHYVTESDGDHSLEETVVIEQAFPQHTLYTVQLQFASGSQQSFAIVAPPGGLQPELLDMSGDNIANDVVLTSKLLGLPFAVLLNEGHDRLTLAISPGSFASDEGSASGPGQVHHASALPASGFRAGSLLTGDRALLLELKEKLVSRIVSPFTKCAEFRSSSGRAPPGPSAQL